MKYVVIHRITTAGFNLENLNLTFKFQHGERMHLKRLKLAIKYKQKRVRRRDQEIMKLGSDKAEAEERKIFFLS